MKGKIVEHVFWLKKNGYKESTIGTRTHHLKTLVKLGANLLDPESVKEVIAKLQCIEDTKAQYTATFHLFTLQNDLAWDPPSYRQHQKIPFIPTEAEIDQLIAAGGKKTATLLQLLKETALRIGEAWRLRWIDVDFKRQIITLNTPEKNSKARIFNVS
ncbi:tyrosine-type recombinase/integrase, partial [Candidatus Bathyarchaeota archaeon]|nr:tyrosine-type recombinase/integrase [Candidatus Bathyarchaeota archaeon]